MTPPNRSTARKALADLLEQVVTAAAAVYDHQVDDLAGQSPVIAVTSAGSERTRLTLADDRGKATFAFAVHVFVLYRADGWTPAQAEDALDEVEQQVCQAVLANPRTLWWKGVAYAEPTEARDVVQIGGVVYLHEVIPVACSVF